VHLEGVPPATPFRYTERPPSSLVSEWILSYWHFTADDHPAPHTPHTVMPDGCTSIAVLRLPAMAPMVLCVGPRATSFRPGIVPGMQLAGIRLWPDTTRAVLGVPPPSLRDHQGPAPESIAGRVATLADTTRGADSADEMFDVMESWAGDVCRGAEPPEPRVRRAVRAIAAARGEIAVTAVALAAHTSPRQLQRLFPAATGLTVSEYARLRRLREALAMRLASERTHWSRIAAERGFTDHSHLTREFLALTGVPPSEVARQLARIEHRDVTP
jgi:AraC-like DNA-binding protein